MNSETIKEQAGYFIGSFLALFACVYTLHGVEQALEIPALIAMFAVAAIVCAISLFVPGSKSPTPLREEMNKAVSPLRATLYSAGVLAFGAVVFGIGYL